MGRRAIKNIDKKIIQEVMNQSLKHGIDSVSTKDLAKKLHISEPVIFSRFQTKKGLMLATFETAWNSYEHTVVFPDSLTNEDNEKAFSLYKEQVKTLCDHKKEFVYISEYIQCQYRDYEKMIFIEKEYRDEVGRIFLGHNKDLSEKELMLLEENYLETSIDAMRHVVRGHYSADEATLFFYFVVHAYGYIGFLHKETDGMTSLKELQKRIGPVK